MRRFNRLLAVIPAAAAALAFGSAALAVPVVTWEATFDNGFDQSETVENGDNFQYLNPNPVPPFDDTYLTLAWGIPGSVATNPTQEQSRLEVSQGVFAGGDSVNVTTNGPRVDTIGITHFNNAILCAGVPAGGVCPALQSTVLRSSLTLTAIDPDLGILGSVTESFEIDVVETRNLEPCFGDVDSICDDIFVLLNPFDLTFDIDVGGTIHTVIIGAELIGGDPLGTLSNEACAEAGLAAGCVGFLTIEGTDNTVLANIRIITQQVPEPGTLAALGAILIAGGLATRRRTA